MKKLVRWSLVGGLSLVVLVVIVAVAAPMFIDLNSHRPKIEALVTEKTGRSFSMGPDMGLSLFPWVGMRLSDLKLDNPKGFSSPQMVAARSFEVRLKVLPLLQRRIEVKTFRLEAPRIHLERLRDGRTNWTFAPPGGTPAQGKAAPDKKGGTTSVAIAELAIAELALVDGVLSFKDHGSGRENRVEKVNLRVKEVQLDQPMSVEFTADVDNRPVSLAGTMGPLGPEPGMNDIPLNLTFKALELISLHLEGRLVTPATSPTLDAALVLSDVSPRAVLDRLDLPLPVTPRDPEALTHLGLEALVRAGTREVFVQGGELKLDDSTLKFSVKVKAFERPDITFDLDLDQMDLDRYLPPSQGGRDMESTGPGEPGAPSVGGAPEGKAGGKTAMDYQPLRQLVVNGRLKAKSLKAANARVENLLFQIRGQGGLFFVEPLSMDLYQGTFNTRADIDVRGREPRVKVDLNMQNVQAGPLMRDVQQRDIIEGALQATMSLSMVGDTPRRIKETLKGKGEKVFFDGAIKGIDIAATIRSFTGGDKQEKAKGPLKTDFAELRIPFTVGGGVSRIKDARLKSPLLRVSADGSTHLLNETMDFRLVPKLVATLKGQGDEAEHTGIAVPVLVSGPFNSPRIRPDMENIIKDEVLNEKGLLHQYFKDPKAAEKKAKNLFQGILE